MEQEQFISRQLLEEMFANIRTKTPSWGIEGDMLWGYFFVAFDKSDLEKIGAELVSRGYHLVEVRQREVDTPEEVPDWHLHVERVETHTVDTLYARNGELEDLADRFNDVFYDGMDVGPVGDQH